MAYKLLRPDFQQALNRIGVAETVLDDLVNFKNSGRKDDPARRQDLHGPFEIFTRTKTGRLPEAFYEPGDPEPWGLLPEESRSNILWQVTAGIMDHTPSLAAAYMALALDRGLSDDDYALELGKLHKDWTRYIEYSGTIRDHHHGVMSRTYHSISCPACNILTAVACRDEGMHKVFQEMLTLKPAERRALLSARGLAPMMTIEIPDQKLKL